MTESPPDPPSAPRPAIRTIRADRPERRYGWTRWVAAASLLMGVSLVAAFLGWRTFVSDLPELPDRSALWSVNRSPGMAFEDHAGRPIAVRGSRHGQRVALNALPPHVFHAFLAAEDHRFYEHGPVDAKSVLRALRANFEAGEVVQGGSTLTQQLARTIWLSPDQTFKRKVQEAIIAWRLEKMLSKDEVLELYLNRVYFGSNAYGVDAAAQVYFGKPAQQLDLPEAALLAALPKAPSRLRPTRDMDAAVRRSHVVLRLMQARGWITADAERAAEARRPVLAPPAPGEGDFGYALDLAQQQARDLAGDKAPDLVVRLTIDSGLQLAAADTVRDVIAERGGRANAEQAALVALGRDGAIRALVGGVDHGFSPFDRAVDARRQPGSSFKPFVYAAALEAGVRPYDLRQDAPVRFGRWSPENFGGGYRGAVTVADALTHSINTVAVRLAQQAGPRHVGELAKRFGVSTLPDRPQLSIALGSYETSLVEMTGAYQVFQQGGRRYPPYLIERIATGDGRVLFERKPSSALQVYDPVRNQMMVGMLQSVIARGTGRRAAFGRPAAGKTGTSQDYRDAWFIGFTPDWVAGVWVGNDDNQPMRRVTGGDLPAEIWRRFMTAAHKDVPPRPFPVLPGLDPPPPLTAPLAEPADEAPPAFVAEGPEPPAPREAPVRRRAPERRPAPGGFYDDLQAAFGDATTP